MENRQVDAEFVLEHQGYVKRLARSLVFDEQGADDLAQQVWLAALEHPPEHPGALRGWLAAIARNLASLSRRGAARRTAREIDSSRSESVPAADELVVRESQRSQLVRAVLALGEPYREAVILRYFDELPPRAIAAKQGVSVATVKSRLKRGLATLRWKLDREHGGRAAWSLAFVTGMHVTPPLATVAGFGAKSFVHGVLWMSTGKKIALAVVAVVAALVALRFAPSLARPTAIAEVAPGANAELVEPVHVDGERVVAPNAESANAKVAAKPAANPKAATDEAPGALDVHVLLAPDRTPLAGVTVTARLFNETDLRLHAKTARTDADGVAHFAALAPGDIELDTDRGFDGYALVKSGTTRSATILCAGSCTVTGRVIDEANQPVAGAELWLGSHGDFAHAFIAAATDATGRFEILGLKASSVYLTARERDHAPSAFRYLTANEGAKLEFEFRLGGPGASVEGDVRDELGTPLSGAFVDVWRKRSNDANPTDLERASMVGGLATITDAKGHFVLEGLPPGASWIEARALEFRSIVDSLELAGGGREVHDIRLSKGASLSGVVTHADGKPARDAFISLHREGDYQSLHVEADQNGAYQFDGLDAGVVRATVQSNDSVEPGVELELCAGEELTWNVTLGVGRELVGRVLDEFGNPAPKVQVNVEREVEGEERFGRASSTDLDGRFRVAGLRDVDYVLTVREPKSMFPSVRLGGVRPSSEELVIHLDPAKSPSAFITGRVVGPDGEAIGASEVMPSSFEVDAAGYLLTAEDGSFRMGPFPAGTWWFSAEHEGFASFNAGAHELAANSTWDLGAIRLQRGNSIVAKLLYPDGSNRIAPSIMVRSVATSIEQWCKLDGDRAKSPPLAPGKYELVVEGAYAAMTVPVELVAGRDTEIAIDLKPGIAFKIRFVDRAADPKPRTTIRVLDAKGEPAMLDRSPRLEQVGPFEFPACLAAGHYRVEAKSVDGRETHLDFDVAAATANTIVELELH